MIPETLGHRVQFGENHILPIVAWDDEGRPVVAGRRRLVTAEWLSGQMDGWSRWVILDPVE